MISRALPSFWKCYHVLPQHIQKLAHEKFTLFQSNPYHPSIGLTARLTEKRVAFFALSHIIPLMSLAELKEAVAALSPGDLSELAQFIRQRENLAWDHQIDADFAEKGRLRPVLEEVRENIRAGNLRSTVTGRADRRFWKCFEALPPAGE